MQKAHSRLETSLLTQWWWSVDRWVLCIVLMLLGLGVILSFAASPSVAQHLHLPAYYFVLRHAAYGVGAILTLFLVSLLPMRAIKIGAWLLFFGALAMTYATLFMGHEIKGAQRWLMLGGISIQPSEFVKPAFIIISSQLLAQHFDTQKTRFWIINASLYLLFMGVLVLQPDFGTAFLISATWFAQFFFAGLAMGWIIVAGVVGISGLGVGYLLLPHVQKRVAQFFDTSAASRFSDKYQVSQSLEAFQNGGFLGMGPGEGIIKNHLPDAHADFVFAVMGEEFGALACIVLVCILCALIIRCFRHVITAENPFILLAIAGLSVQFSLQALINMSSTLNLIPTKGMTLPFISYGGSSLLSLGLAIGFILAFTRHSQGRY